MSLNLLVQILEERGILTDRELKGYGTDLKEKVIEEIKH